MAKYPTKITLVCIAAVLVSFKAYTADWIYVVSDGDNLWNLSKKYLGSAVDWHKVQKVNQLPDPHWISPGTRLRIPLEWIESNSIPAKVRSLAGKAYLTRRDGSTEELLAGSLLYLGDRLQTTSAASATIEFADGSILTLNGGSELSLDHLSAYGETGMVDSRLRLLKGRAETRVTPANGPGSRFEIHTSSAISAVRGTEYRIAFIEGSQTSNVEVTGGAVDVSDTAVTENKLVGKGFGTVVQAGRPPLPPKELLPGPVFDALPDKIDRLGWPVSWTPVDGAQSYKVQLADAPEFETIRWQRISERPRFRLPDLPDGRYYLRVRAIDELGLEGLDSLADLIQDARPQPPVPLQPADAAVFLEQAPKLSWSRSLEASTYRLQIAKDPDFEKLTLDKQPMRDLDFTEETTAQLGSWYWRVASLAEDGEQGPFGAVRQFTVKPIPAEPVAEASSDDKAMTITWRAGGVGETYRVQIAEDRKFKRLLLDDRLTEAKLTIEFIADDNRFFRVQAIDSDGDRSAWGAVQEIPPLPDKSWKVFLGSVLIMVLIAL